MNNPHWVGPFYSQANGRFVSVEIGRGGSQDAVLRARAQVADLWEEFFVERLGYITNHCTSYRVISLANYRYISAELGYPGNQNGILRARGFDPPGKWEYYTLCASNDLTYFNRNAWNGLWVSAELGWGGDQNGILHARTTGDRLGPWERFV